MTDKDEVPAGWERGIGEPVEDDETYTVITNNYQWGSDGKKNADWEELQYLEGDEAREFVREWCGGEWPDEYDEFPECVELEVFHDSGESEHHVVLYEQRYCPKGHEQYGDLADEGYPHKGGFRFDTSEEAFEKARELMAEYAAEEN